MQEEIIDIEKDYRCFSFLTPEELDLLNSRKTKLLYKKGEQLFKEGALASNVILVLNGLIKKYAEDSNSSLNLGIAAPGDFLAFGASFGIDKYVYSAGAIVDTDVCMIDQTALVNVFKQNREFSYRIAAKNLKKEEELIRIIKSQGFKQMRGKLAQALIYLSSPQFLIYDVFTYLSRQDIAEFANISIESTVKILKEFEKEKIIKMEGKKIEISDKSRMENIAFHG